MPDRPSRPAKRTVRYHLRVPLTAEHAAVEIEALRTVLTDAAIDEAMFFVPHAEERSTGLGTEAEIRASVERLKPVFEELRGRGVTPSINIWWTASFSHFPSLPRVQDNRFPFRWAVNPEGKTSRVAACPRCEAWRTHTQAMYAAYAALKPAKSWIDDDVHTTLRADMHAPCFCDSCLAAMGVRTGRTWTRADLMTAIMRDPNPVREAWLDFQNATMLEITRGLADAVHAVSPGTAVCLMHSGFEYHATEGRDWRALVESLGQPRPHLRPSIGPYTESTGPGVASGLACTRLTQAVLGNSVGIAPEIENYPHSRFAKSAAIVAADLVMAQLFGLPEMTFSVYRFGGRLDLEIRRSRVWQTLLGTIKPRLQALADLRTGPDQQRGVALYFHERTTRHALGAEGLTRPSQMARRRPWDLVLPQLGFPVFYGLGPVTAFAGEQIDTLSKSELEKVFSAGVLLDARAADCLRRRGLGAWAGIVDRRPEAGHAFETIDDAAFGELEGDVMNTRWEGAAWQFEWQPGARPVSRLHHYDGTVTGTGVVLFENALGGRVAIYPYDSQAATQASLGAAGDPYTTASFLCAPRQAQLRAVLGWLNRRPLPLAVRTETPVYPLLIEQPRRWIAAVLNLSADRLDGLDLELTEPPFAIKRIRIQEAGGRWKTVKGATLEGIGSGMLRVKLPVKVAYLEVAVVTLEPERGRHD